MPRSDVLPALQQGAIDGALAGMPTIGAPKFGGAAKYVTKIGQPAVFAVVELGRKWFDALPADLQQIIERDATREAVAEGRTRFAGPCVILEPNLAQCIAIALHELATNAAKYGALSVAEGHVHLTWSRPSIDAVVIRWIESGGPHVKKPGRSGFGTRVMQTMMQQSNGEIAFDWRTDGLVCEIWLSA